MFMYGGGQIFSYPGTQTGFYYDQLSFDQKIYALLYYSKNKVFKIYKNIQNIKYTIIVDYKNKKDHKFYMQLKKAIENKPINAEIMVSDIATEILFSRIDKTAFKTIIDTHSSTNYALGQQNIRNSINNILRNSNI